MKYTGQLLPDAYLTNTAWFKDKEGKSQIRLNPTLLQPSFHNDLSLQIKRSMIVQDLNTIFSGVKDFHDDLELKSQRLGRFKKTGDLRELGHPQKFLQDENGVDEVYIPNDTHPDLSTQTFSRYNFLPKNFNRSDFYKLIGHLVIVYEWDRELANQFIDILTEFAMSRISTPFPEFKKTANIGCDTIIAKYLRNKKYDKKHTPMDSHARYDVNRTNHRCANFHDQRPDFFCARLNKLKPKKGTDPILVAEWVIDKMYFPKNRDLNQMYNHIGLFKDWGDHLPRYSDPYNGFNEHFAGITLREFQTASAFVLSRDDLPIQDRLRMIESNYKIKERSYDSIVNSIAW
tara:strand:- start:259 stop:1293 length:1035 start_codon:yes stop_codon:yes gene_type:complete